MFKRLLTTSALAALLVTPALAWQPDGYRIVNGTNDKFFYITSVTIAPPGAPIPVGEVGPHQYKNFSITEAGTCEVSVTISQQYGPQIRAPNLFNACSQSVITVTILPNGQWAFTYN